MKDKQECQISVSAALSALLDDVGVVTRDDLCNLMTLTLSSIADAMIQTVGHQTTTDVFKFAHTRVQSRVLTDAANDGGVLQ